MSQNLPGTLTFYECCRRVIAAAGRTYGAGLIHIAAEYANYGLRLEGRDAMKVQALYILNNLSGWRGEEASMVKAQLKEFAEYKD